MTTVWAFRPLVALNNQTGFVECDDELAAQLIELGQVQDPRHGGTFLTDIDNTPLEAVPTREAEYADKEVLPKRRR